MHIPSLGSRQISDLMSLFSGRKSPQAAFPQHGGYQDQNQQQNRWHFWSEDRSIYLSLLCQSLLPGSRRLNFSWCVWSSYLILAVCSKSHYRCNYHRKKQLCLGIKNVNANNKTVKSSFPMFYPISGVVVPFPAPQSSVVMVVVLKVAGVWSLSPGRLWCSWWWFCLSLRPIWVQLYDC